MYFVSASVFKYPIIFIWRPNAYITNAWSWFVVKIAKYIQIHFVNCNIRLFAIAADFISLRYGSLT